MKNEIEAGCEFGVLRRYIVEFIQQVLLFPAAEFVHAIQGVLTGWLLSHGILRKEPSSSIAAGVLAFLFVSYEVSERWRINDSADLDIMAFLGAALISGLAFAAYHLVGKWRCGHGQD